MQKKIFFLIFLLFFSLKLQAIQEFETVVKDIQFNSSSRIVIDKDEIEKSHAKSVTSLLAVQANISIVQSNFTPSSIYIRGGDSSHVLILVDGVSIYDASSVQRTINLNSLDIKAIQKIEVIKGSQSVLYGGQALSAVIKIETIPKDLKSTGYAVGQRGNFSQLSAAVGSFHNLGDQSGLFVRGSYSQKEAASPVLNSKKSYPTRLGTGELGYVNRNHPLNYLLKMQTSFDKTLIATTAFPAYSAADADGFETSTYQLNYSGQFSLPKTYFKPVLAVSQQQNARLFEQSSKDGGGLPTKQDYKAELLNFRFETTWIDLGPQFIVIFGGTLNKEKMTYKQFDVLSSDVENEFSGYFLKAQSLLFGNFLLEGGLRSDYKKSSDQTGTYQVGVTMFDDYRIEYSTGLKQPSLFQLFSSYGNSNIKPERSTSLSVSAEHKFSQHFFVAYVYFENRFENLIVIRGSPQKYENVESSRTFGHELALTLYDFFWGLSYNLNLGYQEPYDNSQGTWLVRRSLRTASLKVRKDFEKLGLGIELIHNGNRRDRTGSTSYGTLSSYTLLNLIADYRISSQVDFFSRLQNVADHHYESSYGFYDEGINIQIGAQVNF